MSPPRWPRPLTVLARWLLGTVLVTWRYLWETTPLYRAGECEGDEQDRPPRIPTEAVDDTVQLAEDGFGPLFHRTFRVHIAGAEVDGARLVEQLCCHFEHFVPSEVVGIRVGELRAHGLNVADELLVEMPGPWNGPVRVVQRDSELLHLVTLRGHMEAGQVQFRARGTATCWCSRSSCGRAPPPGWCTCCTRICAWRRRSSSTCGSASACPPSRPRAAGWWTECTSAPAGSSRPG